MLVAVPLLEVLAEAQTVHERMLCLHAQRLIRRHHAAAVNNPDCWTRFGSVTGQFIICCECVWAVYVVFCEC